jgi:hypothetical protein
MFYLKVMNPSDLDYKMYSAKEYRVESTFTDSTTQDKQQCERYIFLDEGQDEIIRSIDVSHKDVYIMNVDGKTVDRIISR